MGRYSKPLYQFNEDGTLKQRWLSLKEASEGIDKADLTPKQVSNVLYQHIYNRSLFKGSYWSWEEAFTKRNVF